MNETAVQQLESTEADSEARPIAIDIAQLSKSYKLYEKPFDFLWETLTGRSRHREKKVLHDISLQIHRGEVVGIIGRNGAGKSTLLRIIAGTLSPTCGEVKVAGRVSAILELGTGFNPQYSGRDNVIMAGLMRGLSEAEVRRKFNSVVAFSGLEAVIDQPFHTYSSGMQARLAFAAAVSVEADIIIIDEALAAGDVRFAARSLSRIHEIAKSGVTALFVSHTTYQVMQLCSRAIWIDDGRVVMDGPPIEVVRAYEYEMHQEIARDRNRFAIPPAASVRPVPEPQPVSETERETKPNSGLARGFGTTAQVSQGDSQSTGSGLSGISQRDELGLSEPSKSQLGQLWPTRSDREEEGSGPVSAEPRHFRTDAYRILEVQFIDKHGKETKIFRFGDIFRMRVKYECLLDALPTYSCGVAGAFSRVADFEHAMYFNTCNPHSDDEIRNYFEAPFRRYIGKRGIIECVIDPLQVRAGEYYVSVGILPNIPSSHEFYEQHYLAYKVSVLEQGFDEPAVFYPIVKWIHLPVDNSMENERRDLI